MSVKVSQKIKIITLCGSMKVIDKIIEVGKSLKELGFDIRLPSLNETSDYSKMSRIEKAAHKKEMITRHLARIKESDAILVVNEPLKGIDGYIGSNTFLEMGFAFALRKKIFILNKVPDQGNVEEILGLEPVELAGDLRRFCLWV